MDGETGVELRHELMIEKERCSKLESQVSDFTVCLWEPTNKILYREHDVPAICLARDSYSIES